MSPRYAVGDDEEVAAQPGDQGVEGEQVGVPAVDGENKASDQEQALKDRLVHNAMLLIHEDPKTAANIVKRFKDGAEDDPAGTLASLGVMIAQRLWDSAKGQIDLGVMLHAGPEIMNLLVEVAETASAHEYTDEEKQSAFQKASAQFQANNPNAMPQDQAKGEWDNLRQQDADGEIDRQFPDGRQHYEGVMQAADERAAKRPGIPAPGNRKARRAAAAQSRRRGMPQPAEA